MEDGGRRLRVFLGDDVQRRIQVGVVFGQVADVAGGLPLPQLRPYLRRSTA